MMTRAAALCMLLTPCAYAQCVPTWDTALGNPGIATGNITNFATWDDGTGEKLYAGGSFTDIGGNTLADRIAAYDPSTGQWSHLGSGLAQGNTSVYVSEMVPWDDGTGEKLYVSGQFFSAGGLEEANSFAAWDGESWTELGAGFTQIDARVINKILPIDLDGSGEKLLLAGNFEDIGDLDGNTGIALFDGTTYSTIGNGIGLRASTSSVIVDMIVWDDGSGPAIYACGRFTSIDGRPARNVARYDIANGSWESFGQTLIPDRPEYNNTSFAIFDDGTGPALYMGGQQFRINGFGLPFNVAKWDGASWTGIGQQTSGRVTDLLVFDDGNGEALYASGTAFVEVNYFARLEGNTWVAAEGGVAEQPATQGSFASVFGLYEWNDSVLLGGNFTRVGEDLQPARGIAAFAACGASGPCNTADLAEPFGQLDLADISAFVTAFQNQDLAADQNDDAILDLDDISLFVSGFVAGCP